MTISKKGVNEQLPSHTRPGPCISGTIPLRVLWDPLILGGGVAAPSHTVLLLPFPLSDASTVGIELGVGMTIVFCMLEDQRQTGSALSSTT